MSNSSAPSPRYKIATGLADTKLSTTARGLWVGATTGNITLVDTNGDATTWPDIPGQMVVPGQFTQINSAGTTLDLSKCVILY